MFISLFLAVVTLATAAMAHCVRADLKAWANQYVTAQSTGNLTVLRPFIDDGTYTENGQTIDITTGVLTQALNIDHNRSIHDTTQCATFTELIVTYPEHPYVIGTRTLYNTEGMITLMESIVTDEGDWAFNATGYLHWNSLENWDPIPEDKQESRDIIRSGGDAYFNAFNNGSVVIPWGTPCARLEGGAYTGASNISANSCDLGVPTSIVIPYRRYVVDEEMGAVDIFLGFPGLDRTVADQAMPDSHIFRVEEGKIKYIHTVSSCVNVGCGINFTSPSRRSARVDSMAKLAL